MEKFTSMPMHSYDALIKKFPDCPKEVPFELLDEHQAKSNHSQTLQRLAERGGLYPSEMIAVIAKRKFIGGQDIGKCIECINVHLKNYNNNKMNNQEPKQKEWTSPMTWDEFRETGLLFHVNEILHPFGLAIGVNIEDGKVTDVQPMRVKYRGFDEAQQTEQNIKIANYLAINAPNFPEDIKE